MPRPSKHVSPDTLGGRIRAAREQLRLSLADVADGRYSTSLLSQIERNRIDPSPESLRFLADRLHLSLEDLAILVQQTRDTEIEARQYKSYEERRLEVARFLANKDIRQALAPLKDLHFSQVPALQRWRLAALRGQCYFEQRKFLQAQKDFVYAVNELPRLDGLSTDQHHELLLLHLHLAATYRELQQPDAALEHYKITLELTNRDTPFSYLAETHWGMALVAYAQANNMYSVQSHTSEAREKKLRSALEHATNARFLYHSMGEQLRAALVTCQVIQIERALGEVEKARAHVEDILRTWTHRLDEPAATTATEKHRQQEIANVISLAAYTLAAIELEAQNFAEALAYVNRALAAGRRSYRIRRADAYLMRGHILAALNPKDPAAVEAFHLAIQELADTDRIAARISAHVCFAHHLLKIGKVEEGEQELDQAQRLSDLVSAASSSTTTTLEDAALLEA